MKQTLIRFIATGEDTGLALARIVLGLVFLPHGAQKLLGLFGGHGFMGTMNYFMSTGLPAPFAFLVIMAESLGALALVLGLFGRFMAFGIAMVMAGAIAMVHFQHGFFMNWFGTQQGEGFEFHLLALGLALLVMFNGSGRFSLDRFISGLLKK